MEVYTIFEEDSFYQLNKALEHGPAPVIFTGGQDHMVVVNGIIGTNENDSFVSYNDPNIGGGSVVTTFSNFLHFGNENKTLSKIYYLKE